MSSRIGNTALLRARAERLKVEGVRRFAQNIKTDEVIPVDILDPGQVGPQLGELEYVGETGVADLSALTEKTIQFFTSAAYPKKHTQIMAVSLEVTSPIDAAPAGCQFRLWMERLAPFYICDIDDAFSVGAAAIYWRFALNGCNFGGSPADGTLSTAWPGYVPPATGLNVQLQKANTGLAFAAGAQAAWAWFGVQWDVGQLRPF